MIGAIRAVGLAALALSGLLAGFFHAWSVSVMPGLDRTAPGVAVSAMQAINAAVRNPVFFVTFFLSVPVMVIFAAASWRAGARRAALLALAGAAVGVIGVIGPTAALHVPMNEALAMVGPDADPHAVWTSYAPLWTAWNHLRTGAATAMLVLVGAAVAEGWQARPSVL